MPVSDLGPGDELAIRALVVRYAYAISRADGDALETMWSEECRFHLAGVSGVGRDLEGRDEVVSYQREHMGGYSALVQLVGEGLVWTSQQGVEGHWIIWEVGQRSSSDTDRMGVVAYADRYIQEGGRWVFLERRLSVHYNNEALPSGKYFPLPPLKS